MERGRPWEEPTISRLGRASRASRAALARATARASLQNDWLRDPLKSAEVMWQS